MGKDIIQDDYYINIPTNLVDLAKTIPPNLMTEREIAEWCEEQWEKLKEIDNERSSSPS